MQKRSIFIKLIFAGFVLFTANNALGYILGGKVKTLTIQVQALETLLGEMAWVSPQISDTRALYKISFRTCPSCIVYHQTEFPKLQDLGVDTRLFMFARNTPRTKPQERTVVAELYKNRDWKLAQDWFAHKSPHKFYAHMPDIITADNNPERTALIKNGQRQIMELSYILKANQIELATPALIWQNKSGEWRVAIGNSKRSNAVIRKELSET